MENIIIVILITNWGRYSLGSQEICLYSPTDLLKKLKIFFIFFVITLFNRAKLL